MYICIYVYTYTYTHTYNTVPLKPTRDRSPPGRPDLLQEKLPQEQVLLETASFHETTKKNMLNWEVVGTKGQKESLNEIWKDLHAAFGIWIF